MTERSYHNPGRAAPIWCLSTTCPLCGELLRVRRNRRDGGRFIGCSSYPDCTFTSDYDEALDDLGYQLWELREELELAEKKSTPALAPSLNRELKALIFEFHPDRRGETVSTTEVVARLNRLREEVAA